MNEQKDKYHQPPAKSDDDKSKDKGTRRRGKILEGAILRAAWDELSDVGYNHLTMEGIASRAKTNKAVIYRRWPNKPELVVAALQKHIPKPISDVPDTGNLRSDIITLLRGIAQPLQAVGAETMHGLIVHFGKNLLSSMPRIMNSGKENKLSTVMMTIMRNAELRGEISLKKISPRIISLPLDLLRYEILTTHEPISDKTLIEIVDDIFMPLIHA